MAQIEVIGNAGDDAELKFINSSNGDFAVANFSLAETPRIKKGDKWENGETVWWKVSVTGELAETLADMPLKGVSLMVKGDLKQFEYKGRDGATKQGFEIRAKQISQMVRVKRKENTKPAEDTAWPF